jgi:deoxyribodipyrimidine photo-lyase
LTKKTINIVWLKRDLRFIDHAPLYAAQQDASPFLLLYCFEPSVMQYHDSDVRHWRFIYQSLQEMQTKLKEQSLYVFHKEVLLILQTIAEQYQIKTIFSHPLERIPNQWHY